MYDYLLVGSGLFNAVIANGLSKQNKKCLVIEQRSHIGGNCYTEEIDGINVHKYGAHIFRTSDKKIWDYFTQFAEFNNFINSPIARYKDEIYNLPFNMNTFSKLWGISTPDEAKAIIEKQRKEISGEPRNLEEKAISLVGKDVYLKLIKGYTEKQWGRECRDLPENILDRIPVRFTYDNNYYNARFQGIPIGGYTRMFEKMFSNCDIELNAKYDNSKHKSLAKTIIYTGPIDEYYDYRFGELEYRGLRFEHQRLDSNNYQGVAVVNYTERDIPYTRIIEHKHFEFKTEGRTVITKEYPIDWKKGDEPFYPRTDQRNQAIYSLYYAESQKESNVIFGGRLGEYKYYDMQDTILSALHLLVKLTGERG